MADGKVRRRKEKHEQLHVTAAAKFTFFPPFSDLVNRLLPMASPAGDAKHWSCIFDTDSLRP